MKTVIIRHFVFILSTLIILSCGKTKTEVDVEAPIVFLTGEEADSELSVTKGERNDAPEESVFLGIKSKAGIDWNRFWLPLNLEECSTVLAEELRARFSHIGEDRHRTSALLSSLVYCDGPVRITCDKELLGVAPGQDVGHMFLLQRSHRFRINSPDLLEILLTEEEVVEPANLFFREGDCIPQLFYIFPSDELKSNLNHCTVTIEIPVQKELFKTFVKEKMIGNKDAKPQYEKDVLHATIIF